MLPEANRGVARRVIAALESDEVREALEALQRGGGARAEHALHTALTAAGVTSRADRDRVIANARRSRRWGGN